MNNIKLAPSITWFLVHNIIIIFLSVISFIYVFQTDNIDMRYIYGGIYLISFLILSVKYLNDVICTQWEITTTQIHIHKGIIFKKTDFIELYRVIDFQIKTNPIHKLFSIYSIIIVSQDNNTPTLLLYGIQQEPMQLVNNIRQRVQIQRKENKIYEITNR